MKRWLLVLLIVAALTVIGAGFAFASSHGNPDAPSPTPCAGFSTGCPDDLNA